MNSEEFEKLCDELRAQYSVIAKKEHPDATDEEIDDMCDAAIMSELWDMFKDDKISKEDLIKMAGQLGFEPTGDLAEGPAKVGGGETQTIEGEDGKELELSKEAIEEAQGYDEDGKDDGEVKVEEKTDDEEEDDKEDEDEDKERKEARKLYGFED